jgi:HK97 family phage major capsid protein
MDTKAIEDLGKQFQAFKEAFNEKQKSTDVLVEEKLSKITNEMTLKLEANQKEAMEKAAQLEAAINRLPSDEKAAELEEKSKVNSAVLDFMRKGGKSDFDEYAANLKLDVKTLREGVDTDGGYLVRSDFGGIINGRVFETSPLRQFATVLPITSNSIEFVLDDDEMSASATTEEGSRTATNTATIGTISIPVREVYANALVTQSMLDDVPTIDAWTANKIANKIARIENTGFISGDGLSASRGILTYSAWASAGVYESNKVEQVNSGSSGNFTYDGLASLQGSLKEDYQGNARFLTKRITLATKIMTLKDSQNRPIFNLDFSKPTLANPMILGKPVTFCDDIPVAGANTLSLAYGDFGAGYTIVDRLGLKLLRDPYSAKPYVGFYATKRTGGAVTNFEAIKIQKLA